MNVPNLDDDAEILPAVANLYPRVALTDIQWDRVIKVLEERGTKKDQYIAKMIKREIRVTRWINRQREEKRRRGLTT
jgi:hypothetical protein